MCTPLSLFIYVYCLAHTSIASKQAHTDTHTRTYTHAHARIVRVYAIASHGYIPDDDLLPLARPKVIACANCEVCVTQGYIVVVL